ncbi:MAG: thiamine phosphate synthase [Sphingomonadales bacterium]|nr:thiamine phosphate synthase [Sphingomonadales bacterium]
MTSCRLYLITPPGIDDLPAFADALRQAFAGGDVACLQLRLKDVPDETVLAAAASLGPICREADVAFLINDRADLAATAGADGVHLGQGDGAMADARQILGHSRDIGITCHNSRHLAFEAGEAGADYVAFGAFFPTATKKTEYVATPDLLEAWREVAEIPCVAIGGITPENCGPLVAAGADFLAVSSAVWQHPAGPRAAVEAFTEAIEEAGGSH